MNPYRNTVNRVVLVAFLLVTVVLVQATKSIAQTAPTPFKKIRAQGNQRKPLAPAGMYQDAISAGEKTADPSKKDDKKHKVRGDAPCLCWVKAGMPTRAVVLCIHGLGLNSSSWEQLGKKLSENGVTTYAIDVRGFGSWMDAKGRKDVDFKACLTDVQSTLQWLRKANAGRPVFLLGESMGGAIALQATAAYPELIDGLISACAAGDRFKQKKMDLNVALHMLAPGGFRRDFNVGNSIVNQATDNPELKAEWEGDPLNRLRLSPKELMQFQKFMNENHDAAKLIRHTPVLMVQGSKDGLVKPEGTEELFAELATPDKELLMVPNAEHLIFEEGQFTPEVLQSVALWVNRHAPQFQQAANAQRTLNNRQGGRRGGRRGLALVPPNGFPGLPQPGSSFPPRPPQDRFSQSNQLPGTTPESNGQPTQVTNVQTPPSVQAATDRPHETSSGTGETGSSTGARPISADPTSSDPSPFAGVPGQLIGLARQELAEGKYQQAQKTLEAEIQMDPDNAEAHYLLGQSYLNAQDYQKARAHFRKAIRAGHGTTHAVQANQLLMTLPRDVLAPQLLVNIANGPGPMGRRLRAAAGRRQAGMTLPAGAVSGAQPTVIVFNAKWCEPGKDMAAVVAQAQQKFGNRVKFIQIDVDDPANESLIDKYSIGPVPTTVFLTPSGAVADYCVGFAGIDGMINGMAKIVQLSIQ